MKSTINLTPEIGTIETNNVNNATNVSEVIDISDEDVSNGQALIPSVGKRALAYMIDFFLVAGLGFLLHMLILWSMTGTETAAMLGNLYVLLVLVFLINGCFHIFFESNVFFRATPGKFFCGLQVVDVDGFSIDKRQSMMRFIWRIPSILLLFFPYLIMGRGNYGLALHDLRAFTVVTTRMDSKRLQSGLLAGRQKTRLDKVFLIFCGLFLFSLLISVVIRFISAFSI